MHRFIFYNFFFLKNYFLKAVRFLYAFALNRRNKNGDRDKALTTVEQIMDSSGNQMVSPGIFFRFIVGD